MKPDSDPLDYFRKLGIPEKFTESLSYRVVPDKAISPRTVAKEVSAWPQGAVVHVRPHGQQSIESYAVFLYAAAEGFVWMGTDYADPNGYPGHAGHRAVAMIFRHGDGFRFFGPEWTGEIKPYRGQDGYINHALECFNHWLSEKGRTIAQERRRVRRMLGNLREKQ